MKQKTSLLVIAILMIVAAALSRLAFYPLNFSPVIAMALFGGAVVADKKLAFALPLIAMFLSDVLFEVTNIAPGFWGWGQLVGYGILALITILGFSLKNITALNIAGYSVASSLIFFFLSNSSVWLFESGAYAATWQGWATCLAAGIPFLKNGLAADLAYSTVLFGSYFLFTKMANRKAVA
ncbi:MAG: hypothetical protein EOO03_08365 [Chitinophagaceae bacterium]|nr:MAG: hypothetical protein EOO03_08365 [Chitinophagaceae bacterium]